MRRRITAVMVVALTLAAGATLAFAPHDEAHGGSTAGGAPAGAREPIGGSAAHRRRPPRGPFAVGVRTLTFVDRSRTEQLPEGAEPRTLVTVIRYPATGGPGAGDVAHARAERAAAPYPLIVFGHGFAKTPALYARLLHAWAAAGYVVAAPVFPLENADAPGGPNEADLPNQPGDMSFLITKLLQATAEHGNPLAGLIDPHRIAVAGHSDGGDTALEVAYGGSQLRDTRVRAAVILSGAEMPGQAPPEFAPGEPPLLATQGTADTINPPAATEQFFQAAAAPKYLLELPGAEHVPPYSQPGPQLEAVERVSIDFLDGYLKDERAALAHIARDGSRAGVAQLTSYP